MVRALVWWMSVIQVHSSCIKDAAAGAAVDSGTWKDCRNEEQRMKRSERPAISR